jgi:hypothetical protein
MLGTELTGSEWLVTTNASGSTYTCTLSATGTYELSSVVIYDDDVTVSDLHLGKLVQEMSVLAFKWDELNPSEKVDMELIVCNIRKECARRLVANTTVEMVDQSPFWFRVWLDGYAEVSAPSKGDESDDIRLVNAVREMFHRWSDLDLDEKHQAIQLYKHFVQLRLTEINNTEKDGISKKTVYRTLVACQKFPLPPESITWLLVDKCYEVFGLHLNSEWIEK